MTPEQIERLREQHVQDDDGLCITCGDSNEWPCLTRVLLADWEEQEKLIRRLALALIDANRLDYPWKDGSRASRALDEAEALRDKKG